MFELLLATSTIVGAVDVSETVKKYDVLTSNNQIETIYQVIESSEDHPCP